VLDLKKELIASMSPTDMTDPAIAPHPLLGYIRLEPVDIFNFMDAKYGTPSLTALRQNTAAMTTIWNPSTTSIDAHVASLATAISMSALLFSLPVTEFDKCEHLRASMVNAPAHLKKFIDDYDRDHAAVGQQLFQGLDNDGLAPKLIAEAARVSGDLAGPRGFANAVAQELDGDAANAATRAGASADKAGASADKAGASSDKTELGRTKAKLAKAEADLNRIRAEVATLKGAVKKNCTVCKTTFASWNPDHTECKICWDKTAKKGK